MQVCIGYSFSLGAMGWKRKLASCLRGYNVSQIRNKTFVGLYDNVHGSTIDWMADYVLPEITR